MFFWLLILLYWITENIHSYFTCFVSTIIQRSITIIRKSKLHGFLTLFCQVRPGGLQFRKFYVNIYIYIFRSIAECSQYKTLKHNRFSLKKGFYTCSDFFSLSSKFQVKLNLQKQGFLDATAKKFVFLNTFYGYKKNKQKKRNIQTVKVFSPFYAPCPVIIRDINLKSINSASFKVCWRFP